MIYLLRHGDAEKPGGEDSARRLTDKGERQASAAGQALAALDVGIDACLTSPKVRAAETARLACEALELTPETATELRGGEFDSLGLSAGRGDVLLVGHEPDFSDLRRGRPPHRRPGEAAQGRNGDRRRLDPGGVAAAGRPAGDRHGCG